MKRKPPTLAERILFALGGLLLAFYAAAFAHGSFFQAYDSWAFDRARAGEPANVKQFVAEAARRTLTLEEVKADTREWSPKRAQRYRQSLTEKSVTPLGRLDIPSVNLKVVVLDGNDDWTLNRAVGRIPGMARPGEPGNVGIAGHRDGFFRPLRNVKVGQKILLETPGATYTYWIKAIKIVRMTDTEVLKPTTTPTLTLVTCYPFYYIGKAPRRYIVIAEASGDAAPWAAEPRSAQKTETAERAVR